MTTLNEIVYNIAEQAGQSGNNVLIARLHHLVGINRQVVLRQDADRNGHIDRNAIQTFGKCVEMVKSSMVECCGIDLGCKVVRTKEPLPVTVNIKGKGPLTFVGNLNRSKTYHYQPAARLQFLGNQLNLPVYTVINGHLYLLNAEPRKIRVEGILADPFDVNRYQCDGACFSAESAYPLSGHLIQRVTSMIYQELGIQTPPQDDREVEVEKER